MTVAALFSFLSRWRYPSLCKYGTNALIAELEDRGDLWLAVKAYERIYGPPDSALAMAAIEANEAE